MTIDLLTELPDAPSRADPANFASRGDALLGALPTMVTQMNTVIGALNTAIPLVEGVHAVADAAAAATNINQWNAATAYTTGQCVWSPLDFLTYRRKTNGTSATDPSLDTANWQLLLSTESADTNSAATDITLTSTSAFTQTITPTGIGFRFTLADATTCRKKKLNHLLQNAGDYPVGVYDKGGTLRFVMPPQSSTRVSCKDTSTAAGAWVFDGISLPGLFTYFKGLASYSNSGSQMNHVAVAILSATCVVYLLINGSNHLYVQAVNPVTRQEGSPTLIEAGSIGTAATIFRESATSAAVFYSVSGGAIKARGLVVNAATLAFDTISSPFQATTVTEVGSGKSRHLKQLAAGLYVAVSVTASTAAKAQACSFSGATPSWGAEDTVLTSASGNFNHTRMEKIDATRVLVWGLGNGESTGRARALSISGNTISKGNELTYGVGSVQGGAEHVVLTSSLIAQMTWNGASSFVLRGIAITSSTTLAISADNNIAVGSGAAFDAALPVGYRLSDAEAVFNYQYTSQDYRCAIGTFNGTATPTHTQLSQKISTSSGYLVEPDSDCWPHYYYSSASSEPCYWRSIARSLQTPYLRGSLEAGPLWFGDSYFTVKSSDKWISFPSSTKFPRLSVFKKINGSACFAGVIPFPTPTNSLQGTPAVSGNLVAFQMTEVGSSAIQQCIVELVS